MQCLKLYYNIRHNRTPALFTTLLTYNNTVHAHNTRQLHDIHISETRTTLAHKCFSKHLPKLLRIFPELVLLKIDTHSYSGFSRYTRQYLLQQYSYLCLIRNCHICAHLLYDMHARITVGLHTIVKNIHRRIINKLSILH